MSDTPPLRIVANGVSPELHDRIVTELGDAVLSTSRNEPAYMIRGDALANLVAAAEGRSTDYKRHHRILTPAARIEELLDKAAANEELDA